MKNSAVKFVALFVMAGIVFIFLYFVVKPHYFIGQCGVTMEIVSSADKFFILIGKETVGVSSSIGADCLRVGTRSGATAQKREEVILFTFTKNNGMRSDFKMPALGSAFIWNEEVYYSGKKSVWKLNGASFNLVDEKAGTGIFDAIGKFQDTFVKSKWTYVDASLDPGIGPSGKDKQFILRSETYSYTVRVQKFSTGGINHQIVSIRNDLIKNDPETTLFSADSWHEVDQKEFATALSSAE